MPPCALCQGLGKTIGYGCPGFVRIEIKCAGCDGTGVAPDWQAQSIALGNRLREIRRSTDHSLREFAQAHGLTPPQLSDAEHGRTPVAEWPDVLRTVLRFADAEAQYNHNLEMRKL